MLSISAVGMIPSRIQFLCLQIIIQTPVDFGAELTKLRTPIPPLSHARCDVADDAEKASVFNQYFCSVFYK